MCRVAEVNLKLGEMAREDMEQHPEGGWHEESPHTVAIAHALLDSSEMVLHARVCLDCANVLHYWKESRKA